MKHLLILISLLGLAACDLDEESSDSGVTASAAPNNTIQVVTLAPPEDSNSEDTPSSSSSSSSSGSVNIESIRGSGVAWKPYSDSYRALVVILNTSHGRKDLAVLSSDAKRVLAKGTYARRAGDGRLIYRFPSPGSSYPSPCVLKVGNRYFRISDSSEIHRGT